MTRKGQTTIPKELREKYGITEGTRLDVIDTGNGVLLRKVSTTADLMGTCESTFEELTKRLDKMRREDD